MSSKLGWSVRIALVGALGVACGGAGTGPATEQDGGAPIVDAPSNVSVSETPIDFGFADCGGPAPAQKVIKIVNAGGGTVAWSAEMESPGFTIVGATAGVFSGAGAVNFAVQPDPIPSSAAAATEQRATVVVQIDKSKVFRVPLRVTSRGATLSVDPGDVAFGELPINVQAPDLPITIKNTGNQDVTLDFAQPSATDFGLTWSGAPAAVKVGAGGSVPGAAARFRPSRLTQQITAAPFTVKGAICGASATRVTMNGKGTGGVVGISPGTLDFLQVPCGTKGSLKAFTILNAGTAPFKWSASLTNGNFDLSATDGTLLANNQSTVFVTPKDIPKTSAITPNLYGDTVTITTDAANDTPHTVTLLMTAKGAILAFAATPTDYGVQGMFASSAPKAATISNTGNAAANVTLVTSDVPFVPTPAGAVAVPAGGMGSKNIVFAPTDFGDTKAELGMKTSDVICQPLPDPVTLTGTGKGVATQVAVGSRGRQGREASTCALLGGGHVACWGDNQFGQLGLGFTSKSQPPTVIPNFSGAVALTGGGEHNCAVLSNGKAYCWGRNSNQRGGAGGQLGTAGGDKSTPTLIASLSNVISISAAHRHTCAVSAAAAGGSSGTVYCFGINQNGQLGVGTNTDSATPLATSITDAVSVSTMSQGGCARRVGNTVKCWGPRNRQGQLGTGNTNGNGTGTPAADVVGVSGGLLATIGLASGGGGGGNRDSGLSCAVRQNVNDAVCWGDNGHGKIRGVFNSNRPAPEPVPVVILGGATAVATGRQHACAIVAGGVKCWGRGESGQLGNAAAPTNPSPPVSVTGLANVTQISASGRSTCAVMSSGSISCWGLNDFGQLGNPLAGGTTATVVTGF